MAASEEPPEAEVEDSEAGDNGEAGVDLSDPNLPKFRLPKRKQSKTLTILEGEDYAGRCGSYNIEGGGEGGEEDQNFPTCRPAKGVPTGEEAAAEPAATLKLQHSFGYNGHAANARANLIASKDGSSLIYYTARVCVVHDIVSNSQRFFQGHDAQVSAICMDPREGSTLIASGQRERRKDGVADRDPNQGRTRADIVIWDYRTCEEVCRISPATVGEKYVNKLAWSEHTGFLYALFGDSENTLRIWDMERFFRPPKPKAPKGEGDEDADEEEEEEEDPELLRDPDAWRTPILSKPMSCERILGISIDPSPNTHPNRQMTTKDKYGTIRPTDEGSFLDKTSKVCPIGKGYHTSQGNYVCDAFILFGRKRIFYGVISEIVRHGDNGGLVYFMRYAPVDFTKCPSVNRRDPQEKNFICGDFFPNGRYLVGGSSGAVYLGFRGEGLMRMAGVHASATGCIRVIDNARWISVGGDGVIRRWEFTLDTKRMESLSDSRPIDIDGVAFVPRAAAYNPYTRTVFIGSKSNQIISYNFEQPETTNPDSIVVDAHSGGVAGIATHPSQAFYITGGYDGTLKLWSATTRRLVRRYEFPLREVDPPKRTKVRKRRRSRNARTGKFSKDKPKKKKIPKPVEEVTCLKWSNRGKFIVAGTKSSKIFLFVWDPSAHSKLALKHVIPIIQKSPDHPVKQVEAMAFSADDSLLGVASGDGNAYIYTLKPQREYQVVEYIPWKKPLEIGEDPTFMFQFSADAVRHRTGVAPDGRASAGGFCKVLSTNNSESYWQLDTFKRKAERYPGIPDPDIVEWQWQTKPNAAGWDTQGLTQDQKVNDCTTTADNKFLASAGEDGQVRIANYPCVKATATKAYAAHDRAIEKVEFLKTNTHLISTGGRDCSTFVWRVPQYEEAEAPRETSMQAPDEMRHLYSPTPDYNENDAAVYFEHDEDKYSESGSEKQGPYSPERSPGPVASGSDEPASDMEMDEPMEEVSGASGSDQGSAQSRSGDEPEETFPEDSQNLDEW